MPRRLLVPALLGCLLASPALAADPTYWQDVRPILRKSCTVCHNQRQLRETDVSGGLALDTFEAVLRWKEKNKPLVHPGKSATSPLYTIVVTTDTEKRMPLGAKPLPNEAIAVLKRWIDTGAREGTPPATVATAPAPSRRRKLDITLATTTTPAPADFAGKPRGPLTLAVRAGPLAPVVALAFHPTQPWLAAGAYGRVTVWDYRQGQPVQVLTAVLGAVNDLRFSPDGKLLAVAGGQPSARGDLRLFTVADWKLRSILPGHDDVVASVAFRPDSRKLASASYDRTLRTWDVASGKAERVLSAHSDFITCVAYSPDGTSLVSGSKDRAVRLAEADTGAGKFTFSDRNEDVLSVAFSPDGKAVVSAGLEPGLSWWNPSSGEKVRSSPGHRGAVFDLAFSRDGKMLASAGEDATVKLWNGATGGLMRSISTDSLNYSVALSPDSKLVAVGSFDGLVRLIDVATGQPRATLLALPSGEWLTLTPAGYVAGSGDLATQARWLMAGQALPAELLWQALRRPELVAKSLGGQPVPPPAFSR